MAWTTDDVPTQRGKTFVITGANGGLGYEAARALARKGARVVMACRSVDKAKTAVARIRAEAGDAHLEIVELDLGDLESVRRAADEINDTLPRLDVLINNAGVMAIPRRVTAQGFEMQLGTNHLGHFALTGRLLGKLLQTPHARVVTLSSLMHRYGVMRFDDLHGQRRYEKWAAYQQSKLANLLFHLELTRRLAEAQRTQMSVAAHPGYAATGLQAVGPKMSGNPVMKALSALGNRVIAQSAEMGALPTLYAATAPDVRSGDYFGPDGLRQLRGYPRRVGRHRRAKSVDDAARLWNASTSMTGVDYADLSTSD